MIIDKKSFFEIQNSFSNIPFNQTEEWLNSHAFNENIVYFVDNTEQPQLCCWGRVFNRKFIGNHLIIDGISIKLNTSAVITYFFKEITSSGYAIIELSDIGFYDSNFEIGIRRANFIRPLGLSLCPLTIVVKLQEPFSFHRNWCRNVKKAVAEGSTFKIIDSPTINDAEIFISLFNQLKERKNLGFSLDSNSLLSLFKKERFKLFFVQGKDECYLAGRVVYLSEKIAYDIYAANSDIGIKYGTAYFLQEQILFYLQNLGINLFDYGRISPSADHMDNIYVAKSYSGGEPIQYNGQWQYSKSKKVDFLYSLYKFVFNKQKRY